VPRWNGRYAVVPFGGTGSRLLRHSLPVALNNAVRVQAREHPRRLRIPFALGESTTRLVIVTEFESSFDMLWPRGLSEEAAGLDEWCRALAPSAALRTWFGHDPARCRRSRYSALAMIR
jgi:hypothetical protein